MVTLLPFVVEPICSVVLLNTLSPAAKDCPLKVLPITAPLVPSRVIWFEPDPVVIDLFAFTESTVISFLREVVIFLPFLATLMLVSPLKSTVSSFAIVSGVASPLAVNFHL